MFRYDKLVDSEDSEVAKSALNKY